MNEENVCVTCGKSRKDAGKEVWWHREGFRCNECHAAIDELRRTEALRKVAEKEYDELDYTNTNDLLCPHCGTEQCWDIGDGEPSTENECETCGGKFTAEIEYSYTFSSNVIGDRIKLEAEEEK